MFDKIMDSIVVAALLSACAGLAAIPFVMFLQLEQQGVQHVIKVCEETGMYLTEGKAMTCRVLKEGGKQ